MKTESEVKLAYLGDTGYRAEVESAVCPYCEENISSSLIISEDYYEWLIEQITKEK